MEPDPELFGELSGGDGRCCWWFASYGERLPVRSWRAGAAAGAAVVGVAGLAGTATFAARDSGEATKLQAVSAHGGIEGRYAGVSVVGGDERW